MRFLMELSPIECVELGEKKSCVTNRIDADVISASVSSASGEFDFTPDKSAMRSANCQPRRLGDHRILGANSLFHESAHAEAFILLVGHRGDDDLPLRTW